MSKYNPKDVVKIKREIEEQSKNLLALDKEIKERHSIIEGLDLIIEAKRKDAVKADDFVSTIIAIRSQEGKELDTNIENKETELRVLKEQYQPILSLLETAKNTIIRLQSKEAKIISENVTKLRETESLVASISSKQAELKAVTEKKVIVETELEKKIALIKQEEGNLLKHIAEIKDQIESGRGDANKLNIELDRSRRELETIKGRERNVIAMEARLSPKYLEVFNRIPNSRKKKNGSL